jgi:mannose-6-phosphate isomerase-like protein (cupin superfamily)
LTKLRFVVISSVSEFNTKETTMTEHLWFLDTLVTVRAAHADGSDGISVLESVAREGDSPPLHVHETEDEVFHILEGELTLRVGDEDLSIGPGRTAVAPKGVPHTYRVQSHQARWLVVTRHGDFERMVRALSRPAPGSELPEPAGPPRPEQLEALAAACRASRIELVGPPLG